MLVQLKTLNVLESTSSTALVSQNQFFIDSRFLPEGIEDAAVVGPALVWKEETEWKLCVAGNVFSSETSEAMVIIHDNNSDVEIAGKVVKPVMKKAEIATESLKEKMFQRENFMARGILFASEELLEEACIHGPAALVDKVMQESKIDPNSCIFSGLFTPLMLAAANGRDETIKLLCKKYKADVDFNLIGG